MPRLIHRAMLISALALTGCGGAPTGPGAPGANGPNGPTPSAKPTAAPSYSPYNPKLATDDTISGVSDAGIKLLGGSLTVEATDGSGPIAKAVVDVYGPTLATGVTDATGKVSLGPLAPGSGYTVVVHAPGARSFATLQQADLEIKQKMTTSVRLAMVAGTSVAGRVLADGKPVAGAVISDGLNSVITDEKGQYQLLGVNLGDVNLRASKPGYKAGVRTVNLNTAGGSGIDLSLTASSGALFFDTRLMGRFDAAKFGTLKATITAQHWKLVDAPPPSPGDVWVMVCPGRSPSADTQAQATAFVGQGGKLIVLGEWGGFSGLDNMGVNALAHRLGLHFNPDAVREFATGKPQEGLTVKSFASRVFGPDGPASVQLFNACSVFGLSGMLPLASSGPKAYHVQSGETAVRTLAIGGPFGAGKAIAVGDTSAWMDDDADSDGSPDASAAGNMKFWERLLVW